VAGAVAVNVLGMGYVASTMKSPEQRTLLFPRRHPQTRHFHAELQFEYGRWLDAIHIDYVFGLKPYDALSRADPAMWRGFGQPRLSHPALDLAEEASQRWMLDTCAALRSDEARAHLRPGYGVLCVLCFLSFMYVCC